MPVIEPPPKTLDELYAEELDCMEKLAAIREAIDLRTNEHAQRRAALARQKTPKVRP